MTGVRPDRFVPVAVVDRNGVDESVHWGAAVGLGRDGGVEVAVGDPLVPIYPRSSTKPVQAWAMVDAGLDLPPEQLAIVCASHNGETEHLDTVRRILSGAGLDETRLRNTADHPLHQESAHGAIRAGVARSPLQMNCSGKHAGMLATCVANGWDLETYLERDHPLQRAIDGAVERLCGEPAVAVGVDGCGAPAHVVPLVGLARAVRAIAMGDPGTPGARVRDAMSGHPHMVGGTDRPVTAIMRGIPGLVAKDGAEAVFVAALPDGRAAALKIADGSARATVALLLSVLVRLGVDVDGLQERLAEKVLGHGRPVGGVRVIAFDRD
jgi:L-asparaginase II